MLSNTLIVLFFAILFISIWKYGHTGQWGILALRHRLDYKGITAGKFKPAFNKGFDIGFAKDNRWRGGYHAKIYCSAEGICLHNNKIISFFLPDIFIPWCSIKKITLCDYGFFNNTSTCIELTDAEYTIVIAKETLNVLMTKFEKYTDKTTNQTHNKTSKPTTKTCRLNSNVRHQERNNGIPN